MVKNYKHRNAVLTNFQAQVCYGTLLGDSSLSRPKNGRNYHLSCYHSEAQLDWLSLKWHWLQPHSRPIQLCAYTDKRNGKTYKGGRFHTISAPCFTNLAEALYPVRQKIIPLNLSEIINHPIALACLICDDGSWDGAGISIASKQFSKDENNILASALAKTFGLSASVLPNGDYPFVRITAKSVQHTFSLCREYIPASMYYKFGGKNYTTKLTGKVTKVCPICNNTFLSYKSANQIYCCRSCATMGKPRGYATRRTQKKCPICGKNFVLYNRKQETCIDCRDKPFPHEVCKICGELVKRRGNVCCSIRCSVIANHIARGHMIHVEI